MADTEKSRSKFTRGVKCISIHIIVTLLILLVLLIIYVVHLFVLEHNGWDVFRVARRSSEPHENLRLESQESAVGLAYIKSRPARAACNTILLRMSWSLAPAHCLTIRSDPSLAVHLPHWRIRYKRSGQIKETDIKRSLYHSYYNKDDFDNNIGLFQHMDRIDTPEFKCESPLHYNTVTITEKKHAEAERGELRKVKFSGQVSDTLRSSVEELAIVGWSSLDQVKWTPVRVLNHARCSQFVASIVDPRDSELCVYQTREDSNIEGVHGGALLFNGNIVGFHTWGDRSGQLPQVVLLVEPYREWIEDTVLLNS